jgi:nitrite reductase/ring-hydroxylating ferredoxin subunit
MGFTVIILACYHTQLSNITVLISLCHTSDIADPGSKGFELEIRGTSTEIFVVHKDTRFFAFVNSCPHTGATLEWLEDQFLDMDNTFIQCSTHDALFEVDSGLCVSGPCVDDHLTPVELLIENDTLLAQFPDE